MTSALDIAREANVSPSTVSLVLNHPHRVHPDTCRLVEGVMGRLKFKPRSRRQPASVSKNPSQIHHLAFLYTPYSLDFTNTYGMSTYCRELIDGVKSKLGESCTLSIVRGADHVDHDHIFTQQLDDREFDGVILLGPHSSDGYLSRLESMRLPLVVFNHVSPQGKYSTITADYSNGTRQMVEHLAKLGHRRLACFGYEDSVKWSIQKSREGFHDAVKEFGCELVEIEMKSTFINQAPEDIRSACQQALDQNATAFMAGDAWALQLADMLVDMGVNVPQDVSVMGFDDRHLTTRNDLKLTSIGYSRRRMGRMAMQMLQQMVEGRGKWNWMVAAASTYLFEGQTCRPVKI